MLKLYTIIYNCILTSFLLLNFVASILVGAAGHASNYKSSDYIIFGIILITMILLSLYRRNIIISPVVKYLNIGLIGTITLAAAYIMIITIIDGGMKLILLIVIELLFLILSIALIKALIMHKQSLYNS
jgi:hypothetical protein